jgi:hypothetical protein
MSSVGVGVEVAVLSGAGQGCSLKLLDLVSGPAASLLKAINSALDDTALCL